VCRLDWHKDASNESGIKHRISHSWCWRQCISPACRADQHHNLPQRSVGITNGDSITSSGRMRPNNNNAALCLLHVPPRFKIWQYVAWIRDPAYNETKNEDPSVPQHVPESSNERIIALSRALTESQQPYYIIQLCLLVYLFLDVLLIRIMSPKDCLSSIKENTMNLYSKNKLQSSGAWMPKARCRISIDIMALDLIAPANIIDAGLLCQHVPKKIFMPGEARFAAASRDPIGHSKHPWLESESSHNIMHWGAPFQLNRNRPVYDVDFGAQMRIADSAALLGILASYTSLRHRFP